MQTTTTDSLYGFEMRTVDHRTVPREDRNLHNIKRLWQRSHEILRLALFIPTYKEIAEILGVSEATVSNTLNSDLGRKKLSEMRLERDKNTFDFVNEVKKLLPKAVNTYERILDGDETVTKMMKETADTLSMDLGGHRAPTKVQSETAHLHLTPKDIDDFKKRGKAAAKAAGLIIDAEVVDETGELGN